MKLAWETNRHNAGETACAAIEELCDRFRSLTGMPVKLVVIQPGQYGAVDAVVVCRAKRDLVWAWLAYDRLTDYARRTVRLVPYTMADARRNVPLADLLRAHLGWERAKRRLKR